MKCAEQSPRLCKDGTIRWYYGDTFPLIFIFEFTNEDEEPIEIQASDTIEICFRDKQNTPIHKFTSTGTPSVEMEFTEEISRKFKAGEYTYCTKFRGEYIRTVQHRNRVVVE